MEQKKMCARDALCPYLQYHTDSTIVCEGLFPRTGMRTIFETKDEKRKHYLIFCCGRYYNCEMCQALDEIKYGDD